MVRNEASRRVRWSGYSQLSWPLPNVWLGVSVTNQADADERIPHLLRCPAAVRWVSAEPLLGPLDLTHGYTLPPEECVCVPDEKQPWLAGLDWVAAGFQSGPRAPESKPLTAARSLRDQCSVAGVYFAWKNPTGFPPLDGVVHNAMPKVDQ